MRRTLPIGTLLGLLAFVALHDREVVAQSSGMFGTRGAVTATQSNTPYSASSSLGQPRTTTGMGGLGMGATGAGGPGRGAQGAGTGLTGPQLSGINNLGQMSATVGQNGFIGRGQEGFVGNRLAGQQNVGRNQNLGIGQRGLNRGDNPNNQLQQNQFGGSGRNNQNRRIVRPQQRIAFTHPQPTPTTIETTLQTQLRRLSDRTTALNGVTADVAPTGEVILRGEVADEESRRLAEMYVRLEPGVRSVRNELTVR